MASWEKSVLGRTGLEVGPIGLGASYGVSGADVERAFDHGVNYLYWGSRRRGDFGRGIKNLVAAGHRDKLVVVIQSYSRLATALGPSLEFGLRRLGIEYADVLLLGWWNKPPPKRIIDAAMRLRDRGKCRHLAVSCHDRLTFASYINDPRYGAIMVRYNAAHRGAEREVFPQLGGDQPPPGVIAYTATRWGKLLDPKLTPSGSPTPRASDCYRFALTNNNVDMTLSGPRDSSELDEALATLERGPMDEDELVWMRKVGDAVHG